MSFEDKALFDAVRRVKGSGLTQADVDLINRAIGRDVVSAIQQGRKASAKGIALIHEFEDFRSTTYPDPGPTGKPVTGGWGSTTDENGKALPLGITWPKPRWEALFARDLAAKEAAVNFLLGDAPTTQSQFDALVSFAYNVGEDIDADDIAEGLGDSTLLKKHLRGDHVGAAAEFPKWNKSKGKVLNGLVRRRAAEAALYLS